MSGWEYCELYLGDDGATVDYCTVNGTHSVPTKPEKNETLQDAMRSTMFMLGASSWELVSVIPEEPTGHRYFFKRRRGKSLEK